MPKKIDRKTAAIINGTADLKMKKLKCYLHYTAKPVQHHEIDERSEEKPQAENNLEAEKDTIKSAEVQEEPPAEQEGVVDKEQAVSKIICPIHDV